MDAVLLKSAILVLCAVLFHNGINPPTPPPAKENIVYKGQLFEYASRGLIYFWQVCSFPRLWRVHFLTLGLPRASSSSLRAATSQ